MRRSANHHSTRVLTAVALVAVLAACADDAPADDGRYDQDRYQEQDQGMSGTSDRTDDRGAAVGTDDPAADDPATDDPATDDPATDASPEGSSVADTTQPASEDPAGELDVEEIAGLLWMREEEQLAHDVYVALGDEWDVRVFENIAASEQQHIDITIGLLDRYGIADPAAGNPTGTFTDPRMQDLYDELFARGMESKEAALAVGATIEELDIDDLRTRAEATDEAALDDAYARLERASRNHLRAFVGQLDLLGIDYEPTVLADFEEIVSAPMERGRDDE